MAWRPPGVDHHKVETHVAGRVLAPLGDKGFGCALDAGALSRRQKLAAGVEAPRLDLDHGENLAAPCDDVDLANAGVEAPRQNRITTQPQPPDAQGFGVPAEAIGAAARRRSHLWPASSSARA